MKAASVAARTPGNNGERLQLPGDDAAHLGSLDILQRVEDPRESDPRLVRITIGLETPTECAQRPEKTFVISNQDGESPRRGFAQWPVSPYSPYVLSLYQVGVRMVGGVSRIFHRVTGHWGESSKFLRFALNFPG